MELKSTQYELINSTAVITLNRPHRRNAWTGRMHTEYRHCLLTAEQDPRVRVIIVTGAGDGFCVGADTEALEGHADRGAYDAGTPDPLAEPGYGVREEFNQSFAYHFGLTKPVIAAINGPAAGVGLVLALYADIRFAVPGAKLTTAHGKLNLPAEFGLSWILPRIVGLGYANEILLTSRIVFSEEAHSIGMVNRLIDRESLLSESLNYAENLAQTVSPGSLKITKRQVYTDLHRDVGSAVADAEALMAQMMSEPNFKAGVKALMEKTLPQWAIDE